MTAAANIQQQPFNNANSSQAYASSKPKAQCPKCHSTALSRVRRGFFARYVLFWKEIRRYKCTRCEKHFNYVVK